jgi:hypothetical protein
MRARPMLALAVPFALAATGCVFNRAGLAAGDRSWVERGLSDGTADWPVDAAVSAEATVADARRDGRRPDGKPLADLRLADTKPAKDSQPWPDSAGFKPVGTTDLLAVWSSLKVKCIADDGSWNNTLIGPLDNLGYAAFVDGASTLAGATADTKSWAGSKPAVTVIFDPNACGQEDPINYDGEWGSAGLLIRGATLSAGKLVLAPGTTAADMDFLDVTASGAFESSSDFAGADDKGLAGYPQLAVVVTALEQGILQAAK